MAGRTPPRFVPTLTEVVRPEAAAPAAADSAPLATAPGRTGGPTPVSEEQMVHRVLQRIDLTLDRRLREAVAATVLQHTRELVPLLRDEIEQAVRDAVSQAFAEELNAEPHQRP